MSTQVPVSIAEAGRLLRAGEISSVELHQACERRADALDPVLGVYLARFSEQAVEAARAADRELRAGVDRGPLHGIPLGIKDNMNTVEAPTTGNSSVHHPSWLECVDATVVRRLREAGAVITGKLSTMELALGIPDSSKPFPYPRNPWNSECWAGGSSSGSAAGVAAGMFLGAVGSDTGGSIRIPASYCGITGLKPTFGRVPKDRVIPLGNSLDCVGPMTRSAEDAALMLQVMAGHEAQDRCSADHPIGDYAGATTRLARGLRLGVDRSNLDGPHATPEFVAAFDTAVDAFADLGVEVVEMVAPLYDEVTAATIITWNSEAFAYHRRALAEQWEAFGFSVRTALSAAASFSAADFIQAQKVREVGMERASQCFREVDAIVSPTVTGVAPEVDGLDQAAVYASVFTNYWSGLGNPVINLPIGFSDSGLPFGFQIAGRLFDEQTVLRLGAGYQRATEWHRAVPTGPTQED